MAGLRGWLATGAVVATAVGGGVSPPPAEAHTGPANPVASSYLARISHVPTGLEARVLGGDLRMWLRVAAPLTVTVLDYRGAPYVRFSPSGVEVNTNSEMFYLNQPIPVSPPPRLNARTPPKWERVGSGHEYAWHDGRLHALAAVALSPGQRFVGRWNVPVVVNGRSAAITGGLWHADDPTIVWFWPILVVLACLWAICRLGSRDVERVVAYVLAMVTLASITLLALGHQLNGEPFVSTGQLIVLGLILGFVAMALGSLLAWGPGQFLLIVIAVAAVWAALEFLPTLLHGFALSALPTFLTRAATVACLACGAAILVLLFAFRFLDQPEQAGEPLDSPPNETLEDVDAWESLA